MDRLIFDGAFGTYYAEKYSASEFPERANILHPERVAEIHAEYIKSGASAIVTNTFCANPDFFPDSGELISVIEKAWDIAKGASRGRARVFADIGRIASDGAEEKYINVAKIFLGCGARDFIFETQAEADTFAPALKYIKSKCGEAFIIASFAVGQDGYTSSGEYYLDLMKKAKDCGADAVGLNCVCGPSHMLELIRKVPAGYIVSAMPNAGYPSLVNGRNAYIDNPEYFAEKLRDIYSLGVFAVGGCCGTTPRHIKAAAALISQGVFTGGQAREEKPAQRTEKKEFGQNIIAVELPAPTDAEADYLVSASRELKKAGADYITVPDSPLGKAKGNSFMISAMLKRNTGVRVLPHLCCRDKNQIAIKGDLIAANIEGVSAVLAVTGDPVAHGDRTGTKNVFGFNSYELISFIKRLNGDIFSQNQFTICAALNTNAEDFSKELARAEKKTECGADCFLTQPLYSDKDIQNYLRARDMLSRPVVAGIMPLAGYKNAMFLTNEVHGIVIPKNITDALFGKTKEQAAEVSLGYSYSIIDKILGKTDGFYIMTPLKRWELSLSLVKYIKENEK